MGNAPPHMPNRAFKLPIVFLNKRNLFGVLSLSPFQHKQPKTLPCVFSVLCSPSGCNSRRTSDPRMRQVGRDHLAQRPCSMGPSQSLRQECTGGPGGCLWSHPTDARTAKGSSTSSAFPTWGRRVHADRLGWLPVSLGDSLAVGQRAQVLPRRAGSSVPSCELPGPGQRRA